MAKPADTPWRWLGAVFPGSALLMLVLGRTVFASSLHNATFIFYWLACFAFTGLAALVAMVDFFVLRRRTRAQQREFLEDTLREIMDQQAKDHRPPPDTTHRSHQLSRVGLRG